MKAKSLLKRDLSFLLVLVMLFSCWVFASPSSTSATAGKYTISIDAIATNNGDCNSSSIVVYWKSNNGTGSSSNKTIFTNSNFTYDGTNSDDQTYEAAGFPYKVVYTLVKPGGLYALGTLSGYFNVSIAGVSMGSSNTISGESGTFTMTWTATDAQYPKANYITSFGLASDQSSTLTNPVGDNTVTKTISMGTVKDQYGVNWYQDPAAYVVSGAGYSVSGSTVTIGSGALATASNWKTTGVIGVKAGSTVLKNGINSNTNATVTFTGTNPTYTTTWKWHNNGDNSTTWSGSTTKSGVYYNENPSAPSAATATTSYYDADKHYSGGKYNTSAITGEKTFYMTYPTSAAHSYTYSPIANNDTNHNATCACGYNKAVEHQYGKYTDLGNGYHKRTCGTDGCGYVETKQHTWGAWQIIPDGEEANYGGHDRMAKHYRVCTADGCGAIDYDNHTWVAQTIQPPTCIADGHTPYKCSQCQLTTLDLNLDDDQTEDLVPALGHSWGNWTEISDTQHQRVCKRDASHVETNDHTMSAWQNVVPDGDDHASVTARNAVNAAITAGKYNASEQHFKYCTVCGRVEFGTHQYDDGEITTPATCTEKGITTYTCTECGSSYNDTNVAPLGHAWGNVQSHDADDNTTGYTYFQCSRCDLYCSTKYENNATVPDESKQADSLEDESITNNAAATIASPIFNDGDSAGGTPWFYNRDYILRPAALRIEKAGVTTQALRFCANVKVPAGVAAALESDTGDNYIVDFGFVYTQDNVIGGDYMQGLEGDPSMMVIYKTKAEQTAHQIYYNSIVDSRLGKTMDDGTTVMTKSNFADWEGKTIWQRGNDYYITFNLVINVKDKLDENGVSNWTKEYACRPYITYKYHGVEQTVYDEGVSAGTTASNSQRYSHNSVEYIADCIMAEEAGERTQTQLALLKRDKSYCMNRDLCKYLIMDGWTADGNDGSYYDASEQEQKDFLHSYLTYILAEDLEMEG